MRHTTATETREHLAFAERAAKHFAENPTHSSFGDVEPESLLALRWGLGDDCVLVVRLADEVPVIYAQLIREAQP